VFTAGKGFVFVTNEIVDFAQLLNYRVFGRCFFRSDGNPIFGFDPAR